MSDISDSILDQPVPEPVHIDSRKTGAIDEAVEAIADQGFCVLSNLLDGDSIAALQKASAQVLARPAIAGVPGYAKVDHPKKLANPFELGRAAIDLLAHESVIEISDRLVEGTTVLAEANLKFDAGVGYVYFGMHCDFEVGWRKGPEHDFSLTAEQLSKPLGIGLAYYVDDVEAGAFTYCSGTHRLQAPHGIDLDNYPEDMRRLVLDRAVVCNGRAGDVVMFDDRGFHGPAQPADKDRLVILGDYYDIAVFGYNQVSPLQLRSCDLQNLSATQTRALGFGAGHWIESDQYMRARFRKRRLYQLLSRILENAYVLDHSRRMLSDFIRRRG